MPIVLSSLQKNKTKMIDTLNYLIFEKVPAELLHGVSCIIKSPSKQSAQSGFSDKIEEGRRCDYSSVETELHN